MKGRYHRQGRLNGAVFYTLRGLFSLVSTSIYATKVTTNIVNANLAAYSRFYKTIGASFLRESSGLLRHVL